MPANGTAQNYTITYENGLLSIILTPPHMTNNFSPGLNPVLTADSIEATIEANKTLLTGYHPNKKKVYDNSDDDSAKKAAQSP